MLLRSQKYFMNFSAFHTKCFRLSLFPQLLSLLISDYLETSRKPMENLSIITSLLCILLVSNSPFFHPHITSCARKILLKITLKTNFSLFFYSRTQNIFFSSFFASFTIIWFVEGVRESEVLWFFYYNVCININIPSRAQREVEKIILIKSCLSSQWEKKRNKRNEWESRKKGSCCGNICSNVCDVFVICFVAKGAMLPWKKSPNHIHLWRFIMRHCMW